MNIQSEIILLSFEVCETVNCCNLLNQTDSLAELIICYFVVFPIVAAFLRSRKLLSRN